MKKTIKIKTKKLPVVKKLKEIKASFEGFPVAHYSYSSWYKFSSDPLMFKINYLNGDYIDTLQSTSSLLGQTLHKAMEIYFLEGVKNESEATKSSMETGYELIRTYQDGFIDWSTKIPTREKLQEKYAFCFQEYIKDFGFDFSANEILLVEKRITHKVEIDGKQLPIALKGAADLVYRRKSDGKIIVVDHKFTGMYSDEDKIDGGKLVQAAFMYFLTYAELGEKPHSIVFRECKTSKNADGSKQTREYEIVYENNPLIFELFFRLYGDITDALLGKQVYIPNFGAMYDKEVSLLAYIHRLDVDSEKAEKLKLAKIDNITDFLKTKVQSTGAMKKYFETVNKKFISAKTLNYKDMKTEEQIKMKMMQYGIAIDFEDKIVGHSVELYRFTPSVGLKMSKISSYVKDIEQVVERTGVRILAPIPNSGMIGFEVPLKTRTFPAFVASNGDFNINIGVDIMGANVQMDVREMPHGIIAGSSGSGKSVLLHSVIRQLMKTNAELYLFDPKQVEFAQYEGDVHLYLSNKQEIAIEIEKLAAEMDVRNKKLKEAGIRNLSEKPSLMPYKFVIIDEYADLVMKASVERNIQLLAQGSRACGIHLIIATQRASTKVISGDTKVNFPTKIIFKMASATDSKVMIGEGGAEELLGKGDALFCTSTDSTLKRIQCYNI